MAKRFGLAIVGGTFDRFHKGHAALLSKAFAAADRVVIGVTDRRMTGKKPFSRNVESFSMRKKAVQDFIGKNHHSNRCQIAIIHDAFDPSAVWKKADAIVVTKDTAKGARAINAARRKAGLKKAKVVGCPFVVASDGRRISSTRIRLGQMDRNGKVFLSGKAYSKALSMPAFLTPVIRRPFGKLFLEPDAAKKVAAFLKTKKPISIATVGDATFRNLSTLGIAPDLAIVDSFELRASCKIPKQLPKKQLAVSNPAGKITPSLVAAIKKAVASSLDAGVRIAIVVRGEEDLAVLPVVLALPLGSVVLYGQPKKGIVAAVVDETAKQKVTMLLSRFTVN